MPKSNSVHIFGNTNTAQIPNNFFPSCFSNETKSKMGESFFSMYEPNNQSAMMQIYLDRALTKAIYRYIQAELYPEVYYGCGTVKAGKTYVGEYQIINEFCEPNTDEEIAAIKNAPIGICVYDAESGSFMGGYIKSPSDRDILTVKEQYNSDLLNDVTYCVYAMMPYMMEDEEFAHSMQIMIENYHDHLTNPTSKEAADFRAEMFRANNNALRRLDTVDKTTGKKRILADNTPHLLPKQALNTASYYPEDQNCHGNMVVFTSNSATKKARGAKGKTIMQMKGMYAIPNVTYTEEEQTLIPQLPDNIVVSEKAIEIAELIKESSTSKHPQRNFCMFGPSGLGKTTIAQQVAVLLGMPYLIQGCNADTDASDLIVTAVPNTPNVTDKIPEIDVMDIAMDPVGTYKKLTGIDKNDATESDCLRAYGQAFASASGSAAKVRYEKSNLIKGLTKPYFVEVQEPSTMVKPGALPVLNSMLDDCRQITLPSGETIIRDPNSIVFMTTNMGYEGTRDLNQSVLSRCRLFKVSYPDSTKEIVNFLLKVTDFDSSPQNNAILTSMVKVFKKVVAECENNGISQGSCGYRELIRWADEVYRVGANTINLLETCKDTLLLNAAVSNEDDFDCLVDIVKTLIK